jgi:hypothetical protein
MRTDNVRAFALRTNRRLRGRPIGLDDEMADEFSIGTIINYLMRAYHNALRDSDAVTLESLAMRLVNEFGSEVPDDAA